MGQAERLLALPPSEVALFPQLERLLVLPPSVVALSQLLELVLVPWVLLELAALWMVAVAQVAAHCLLGQQSTGECCQGRRRVYCRAARVESQLPVFGGTRQFARGMQGWCRLMMPSGLSFWLGTT
jgi:hypothetical protein